MKKLIISTMTATVIVASHNVLAHLNISQDNFFALGENAREYKEGSSAFIEVNAVEGCKDAAGNRYATTDVVAILPTSPGALSDSYFTQKRNGDIFSANALMFTKARASSSWEEVGVVKGSVDAFYNADRTEGVRAIKWLGGYINSSQYDNLEFKTKLPKIEPTSCIGKLRVEIPTITYCESDYVRAWIGTEGSTRFPADSDKLQLEEEYELYFSVVRDVEKNPYPDSCEKDANGKVVPIEETVRPSDSDIDLYGGREL